MSENPPAKKTTKKAAAKKTAKKSATAEAEPTTPAAEEAAAPQAESTPAATPAPKAEKKKRSGPSAKEAVDATRTQIARVVRLVCLLAAAFLAIGVLLVALRHNVNTGNPVVEFVTKVADIVDGPFSRQDGLFRFGGDNAMTKNAFVNWGIAAIVWLVVGQILSRLIKR